ncbi:hypothetical protein BZG36_03011 [Bifiguratus adelaidae]|uniref:2,6-dihydroxypyridine 3-monooxygenase substrate binding domain-containing protein n=1 Tax=Bifiguratus adelaidae TaxID=1938954 RepID=A0A261XZP5_9FUNG|nr:hypothetical protein BZG36_03011 [Bifiguratus adelaidae]
MLAPMVGLVLRLHFVNFIGGSLGGLMAGTVFRRLSHNVTIIERSPTAQLASRGAGIVVGPHLAEFLSQYDTSRTPYYVASKQRQYLDKAGHLIDVEQREQRMTSWDLLYSILRKAFSEDGEGYGKGEYMFDAKYVGHDVHEDGLRVSVKREKAGTTLNMQADFAIAAEGAQSSVRDSISPEAKRKYAGYVAWRGLVEETNVPKEAHVFLETFTFFHAPATQILAYLIPGPGGDLRPGKRRLNWVWYENYEYGSDAWKEALTDTQGKTHEWTVPSGKVNPQAVKEVKEPFLQAISDVHASRLVNKSGRIIIVGDASSAPRPHTARSTDQAAHHALELAQIFVNIEPGILISPSFTSKLNEWQRHTLYSNKQLRDNGIRLGDHSQFGDRWKVASVTSDNFSILISTLEIMEQ